MNYTYALYTGAITPDYCKYLTDLANSYQEHDATIGGRVIDEKIRSSKLRWVTPSQNTREVFSYLNDFAVRANRKQFGFDISLGNESFQYTEYRAEEKGHYSWHMDCFYDQGVTVSERKLSMVVQLSDPKDYDGGLFCMDNFAHPPFNMEAWAPQGSVIVFPSYIKHCVTPVTRGVRKSFVSWYYGPSFR